MFVAVCRPRGSGRVRQEARPGHVGVLEVHSALHVNLVDWVTETIDIVPLPMSLGGLGVRSAQGSVGHLGPTGLPTILERHPDVARLLVGQLEHTTTPCLQAVAKVVRNLTGPEHFEPGCTRDGWQHEAAFRIEETFRAESLFPGWMTRRC